MPTREIEERLFVTGSGGFIGTHLENRARLDGVVLEGLDLLLQPASPGQLAVADIRDRTALRTLASGRQFGCVVHLAALGEVVVPWSQVDSLYDTNVRGTYHVLTEFSPELFILASTSAVYGTARTASAQPGWDEVCPVGDYGLSKASAEMLCADWSRETGRPAVVLRFGNVIGPGCRGLIRYLVEHALAHSRGGQPARLRGGGRLIRDYVPVQLVVEAILRTARATWNPGVHTLNISSGRGMTNRQIVEIVLDELSRHGMPIDLHWTPDPAPGESHRIVLDPQAMVERLELSVPTPDEVEQSVRAAVRDGVRLRTKEATCASF